MFSEIALNFFSENMLYIVKEHESKKIVIICKKIIPIDFSLFI